MNARIRIKALIASGTLCAMALVAAPAEAAGTPDADAWLAGQLSNGLIHNDQYSFDDYGLTLDVLMALQESGAQKSKQGAIVSAIRSNIKQYVYNYPNTAASDGVYAGSAAKALVAAQGAGNAGTSFGGIDLVSTVENTVEPSGADKGRLMDRDVADYSDPSKTVDYSNLLYQAYGLQALAKAHSPQVDDVRDFLLKQQCSPGYFRLYYTSCAADTDATAIAVRAMNAAKDDGVTGLEGAISKATDWLAGEQRSDGSFGGGESTPDSNANSTGLAASVLGADGHLAAAKKAALWIYRIQAGSASGTKLAKDAGAVALGPDQFAAGTKAGITTTTQDEWRRATAQAALGLVYLDPDSIPATVVDRVVIKVPEPLVRTVTGAATVINAPATVPVNADSSAGRLGQYIAGQFSNGDHIEVKDGSNTFVSYDLTADAALALRQLGQQSKFADRTTAFLFDKGSIDAYAHGAPYEKGASYTDALAKLVIAGTLAKKTDPKVLTGLADELAGLQQADGSFVDVGKYPDRGNGTQRQATAALALLMVGDSGPSGKAVAYIEKSRCADGAFPTSLGKACTVSDPAPTGWALQALNAVAADDRDGATLADVPQGWDSDRSAVIAGAAEALRSVVHVDGSIDGAGPAAIAAVAAGRQSAGLDTRATTLLLGKLQKKDGGLPSTVTGKKSSLAPSLDSAPAIAASSWLGTPGTGLTSGVSLPLDRPAIAKTSAPGASANDDFVISRPVAYAGGGLLGLVLLGALGLGVAGLRRKGASV